jgi:DNA helicase MCM8
LYFPDDEYNEGDPKAAIVNILTQFFTTNSAVYVNADEARLRSRVTYNFQHLKDDIPVADFDSVLRAEPHTVLACLGLATYRALRAMEVPFELSKINVRLDRYSPLTALKDLKSNLVEKFVSIRGNVVRVGPVRPLVIGITFDCRKCGARIPISFPDGRFTLPSGCPTQNCRTRAFEPDRASARTIDFQRSTNTLSPFRALFFRSHCFQSVHLQEIMGSESADAGRIPRSIECELTEDLVDSCIPGDVVTVCGVVKAFKADNAGGNSRDKNKSLFMLYLEVKSVNSVSDKGDGIDDTSVANINAAGELQQFSPRDLEGIRAVASSPQLFRTLVHSFCPAIFGHEMVKAGLSLALFGGVQKVFNISGLKLDYLTKHDMFVLIHRTLAIVRSC